MNVLTSLLAKAVSAALETAWRTSRAAQTRRVEKLAEQILAEFQSIGHVPEQREDHDGLEPAIRSYGEDIYERGGFDLMSHVCQSVDEMAKKAGMTGRRASDYLDKAWHGIGWNHPKSWRKGVWVS